LAPSTSAAVAPTASRKSDLSQGFIIAIAVGVVVLYLALLVGALYYKSTLLRDERFQQSGMSANEVSTQPESEMPVPTYLKFTTGVDDVSTLADSTIVHWRMGRRNTKVAEPSIPCYGNQPGKTGVIFDTPDGGVPVLDTVDDSSPIVDRHDVEDDDECEENINSNQCNQVTTSHIVPWTTKMYVP
jgi:hypothetical protein